MRELPSSKNRRNHTTFQDTLGFNCLDQWDTHVEVSNILGLPISDSPVQESVAVCFFEDELGGETCKIAWNSSKQSLKTDVYVSESETLVTKDPVQTLSAENPDVDDEEILRTADSILKAAGLGKDLDLVEGLYCFIIFL